MLEFLVSGQQYFILLDVLVVERFLEKGMISKLLYRCKIHFSWSLYVSDHVAVSLPGGRILVSAGSMGSLHSASKLYILDPTDEKPTWRLLNVLGRPLRFAWGHSISVVGGRRAIVLGGQTGEEAIKHFSKGLFHMGLILCGLDGTHIGSLYLSNLVVRASIDCDNPLCEIDGVPIGTEYCKVFCLKSEKVECWFGNNIPGSKNRWRTCWKIRYVALNSYAM